VATVVELRNAVIHGIREHYRVSGVTEVRPPLLVDVTGACENVDTLLEVEGAAQVSGNERQEAKEHRGYLSQTGQLALEAALTGFSSCWCQTVSFRDDEPSVRHLREFELVEEEFATRTAGDSHGAAPDPIALFDELLDRIESVIKAGMTSVLDSEVATELGPVNHLEQLVEARFPRVTYGEALEMVNDARVRRGDAPAQWGDDLQPSDEAALISRAGAVDGEMLPVIVSLFPIDIKFFNMKGDPRESDRVLSADLLMPWAGETVGAAVREDDYATLRSRLIGSRMFKTLEERGIATLDAFEPYLELIRRGVTPQHAGYGIGLDRLLQFVARGDDIRDTSLAYRLAEAG
jgi:asparaginyl-tRNA synthetase